MAATLDRSRCQAAKRDGSPCSVPPCSRPDLDPRYCVSHQAADTRQVVGFGGPQPGSGRPRVRRASELVAEAAVAHSAELTAAFRAAVAEGQPAQQRARAAERWLRIALSEAELQRREQVNPEDPLLQRPPDELRRLAAALMARLSASGDLHRLLRPDMPVLEGVERPQGQNGGLPRPGTGVKSAGYTADR